MKRLHPKVYIVGSTNMDMIGMLDYLRDTDQIEFGVDIDTFLKSDGHTGEALCSFYAKACYASLTAKKNKNISRVRSIADNITGTIRSGHGSVLEHCSINFMITGISRVFTHQVVRHRVGTAYSQTSGHYVRAKEMEMTIDPLLEPAMEKVQEASDAIWKLYTELGEVMNIDNIPDMATRKRVTSALRRILPNGQSGELGFTANLRTLRHLIELRTDRSNEWEIREVFAQIYALSKARMPFAFFDSTEEYVENALEVKFEHKKI